MDKLKNFLELQANLNPEHEGITFKEFTDMFVEHEKLYKEWNTIISYIAAFNNFTLLNNLEMNKIKNIDIQKCIDRLVEKRLKTVTIKIYLTKINIVFKSAINQFNILNNNPVQNIDIIKDKSTQEKTALTNNELSILLSKIKNRNYYIISLLAAKCGLRIGEIMGLT